MFKLPEECHTYSWPIPSPPGIDRNLGVEILGPTHSTDWTLNTAKQLSCAWHQQHKRTVYHLWNYAKAKHLSSDQSHAKEKPIFIDLGGASGFAAEQIIRTADFNGLVVDVANLEEAVTERSKRLKEEDKSKGELRFYHADILKIKAAQLLENCYNTSPILVTFSNTAPFYTEKEMESVFKLVSEVAAPNSIFSLYYNTLFSNPGDFVEHPPFKMERYANWHGFVLEYEKQHTEKYGCFFQMACISQGFRLTCPPKTNPLHEENKEQLSLNPIRACAKTIRKGLSHLSNLKH